MSESVDCMAFNRELCAVLGLTDLSDVTRVQVVIESGRWPVLTVTRIPRLTAAAGDLKTEFALVPKGVDGASVAALFEQMQRAVLDGLRAARERQGSSEAIQASSRPA